MAQWMKRKGRPRGRRKLPGGGGGEKETKAEGRGKPRSFHIKGQVGEEEEEKEGPVHGCWTKDAGVTSNVRSQPSFHRCAHTRTCVHAWHADLCTVSGMCTRFGSLGILSLHCICGI